MILMLVNCNELVNRYLIINYYILEIQTWWEIPSIVHFCKVFTLITKDISRIDINVSTKCYVKNYIQIMLEKELL